MERDRVRMDITKRDMSNNKAKLHVAQTILDDLRKEDAPRPQVAEHREAIKAKRETPAASEPTVRDAKQATPTHRHTSQSPHPAAVTPAAAPIQLTKQAVSATAQVVAKARESTQSSPKHAVKRENHGDQEKAKAAAAAAAAAASKRAFSQAVDAIGLPTRAMAEEQEPDEGGSPGREMELASSAAAVETPHGIVDKPYRCACVFVCVLQVQALFWLCVV